MVKNKLSPHRKLRVKFVLSAFSKTTVIDLFGLDSDSVLSLTFVFVPSFSLLLVCGYFVAYASI